MSTTNAASNKISKPLDLSYAHILSIAAPVLIANLAMPLQGAIDVAVVGHLEFAYHLAGLGIASQLWLLVLVSFNFLQYASSGLSAQAMGRAASAHPTEARTHIEELAAILYRSLGLAFVLGILLWLLKPLLIHYGLQLLGAQPLSRDAANDYLTVRYYGIVFELMNYAFIGWFAGQGKTRYMMAVQLLISFVNIVLTLTFVYLLDWGLQGVALGTVIGYMTGCLLAIFLAKRSLSTSAVVAILPKSSHDLSIKKPLPTPVKKARWKLQFKNIYALDKMLSLFFLNKDIFVRTLLLTLSFAWITRMSAQQGDLVMATNALLLQVLSISAFALDGVAVAAESLAGQAAARRSLALFKRAVKRTGVIILLLAALLSLLWWLLLPSFLSLMTDIDSVYQTAIDYKWLAIFLPLVGAGAYWLDGIMFGLTLGKKIRHVAVITALIFFPTTWLAYHYYGTTHAMPVIWLAVYALLLLRFIVAAITLWRGYKQNILIQT